jgi:hypothetical protein
LQQVPSDYNLIVKPHPQLLQVDPARFWAILGKYEKKPNVLFLLDFPLIYPLLSISDLYLGDLSSIGYDFLAFNLDPAVQDDKAVQDFAGSRFNRPMFFLNHQKRTYPPDRGVFLFQCGTVIEPEEYPFLFQKIEQSLPSDKKLFAAKRQEIYTYTFGENRSFSEIKKQLKRIVDAKKYIP